MQKNHEHLLRAATYASVAVASTLFLTKAGVWYATGSVAMLASLVDSLMDVAASVINLIAVRIALTPPDQHHRFGHGKAEALAGLAQAAFIGGSALFLGLQAANHLINPEALERLPLGLVSMGGSLLLTGILVIFQQYVARKTGNIAIKADSLHYITDLASNALVILTLGVIWLLGPTWSLLDPICGLGLAAYIGKSAWAIGKESISHLMDHEIPDSERKRIIEIAMNEEKVLGIHDLRTRQAGSIRFVQLHLELADELTLIEAHEAGERVEEEIEKEYPGTEVIVHLDPLSVIPNDKRNQVQEEGTSERVLAAPMYGAHSGQQL